MKFKFFLVCVVYACASAPVHGEQQKVLGVYKEQLITYTKEGKKTGVLKGVTDEEIRGTLVLDISSRNLILIDFRGKPVWIRASRLKLSLPILAKCPESAPGRATDRTAPVSSGIGAECKK